MYVIELAVGCLCMAILLPGFLFYFQRVVHAFRASYHWCVCPVVIIQQVFIIYCTMYVMRSIMDYTSHRCILKWSRLPLQSCSYNLYNLITEIGINNRLFLSDRLCLKLNTLLFGLICDGRNIIHTLYLKVNILFAP